MSDMYLTKVERKTIFTRGLVYVLLMFVASDLTVTGPYYFNFLPWIFIMGILASSKYVKPMLSIFISSFTVFISSLIVEGSLNLNVLGFTLVTIILMIFGTIVGKGIMHLRREKKLEQFLPKNKKIIMILTIIVITIVSIVITDIVYSGTYRYIKSYKTLEKTLDEKYNIKKFNIDKITKDNTFKGNYIFKIKVEQYKDFEFKYIVKDSNDVTELLEKERNQNLIDDINLKYKEYNKSNSSENKVLVKTSFVFEKQNKSLVENKLTMCINIDKIEIEKNIDKILSITNDTVKFLNEYKSRSSLKEMELNIELSVNNTVFTIQEKDFNKIDKMFIINGLITYEIDAI